jgi:hypothetical protein
MTLAGWKDFYRFGKREIFPVKFGRLMDRDSAASGFLTNGINVASKWDLPNSGAKTPPSAMDVSYDMGILRAAPCLLSFLPTKFA